MELKKLPQIKIWADEPTQLSQTSYRGKFVMTKNGKFFAKLFPEKTFDGASFFHHMILTEMGIEQATSDAVKSEMRGGGKMEVELIDDYVEVRLYGRSADYGAYHPEDIRTGEIEAVIRRMFDLIDLPILVIPDLET